MKGHSTLGRRGKQRPTPCIRLLGRGRSPHVAIESLFLQTIAAGDVQEDENVVGSVLYASRKKRIDGLGFAVVQKR